MYRDIDYRGSRGGKEVMDYRERGERDNYRDKERGRDRDRATRAPEPSTSRRSRSRERDDGRRHAKLRRCSLSVSRRTRSQDRSKVSDSSHYVQIAPVSWVVGGSLLQSEWLRRRSEDTSGRRRRRRTRRRSEETDLLLPLKRS